MNNPIEELGADDAVMRGRYRYALTRRVGIASERACWIMLNPSTADHTSNDPTIRRVINFSHAWGCGNVVVVNLFALRSTSPKKLRWDPDPVGPENDDWIRAAVDASDLVVCAWGAGGSLFGRDREVIEHLRGRGCELFCVSSTSKGAPAHPLYQKKTSAPNVWSAS